MAQGAGAPSRCRIRGKVRGRIGKPCQRADHHLYCISGHGSGTATGGRQVVGIVQAHGTHGLWTIGFALTHEKNQAIGGGLRPTRPFRAEQLHATHYGTDEVDIEDGIYVYKVEDHGDGQEPEAADGRHGENGCDTSRSKLNMLAILQYGRK